MIIRKIIKYIKRLFVFDCVNPISSVFGFDRGKPIDRYYIEKFISDNSSTIKGDILEVEDNKYTILHAKVKFKSYILKFSDQIKVESFYVYGDLSNFETLPKSRFDVFICTQTLNFIFDVDKAVYSIYSILKNEGIALITVACLTQISRYDANRWGDFWRFTPQGIQRIFENVFGKENVEVIIYGNSYSATHFIKGFSSNELSTKKLNILDEDYPIIVALKVKKNE